MADPTKFKKINLTDILSKEETKNVYKILKENPEELQVPKLKEYLQEIQPPLEEKGFLPDYLAYYLYAKYHKIIP